MEYLGAWSTEEADKQREWVRLKRRKRDIEYEIRDAVRNRKPIHQLQREWNEVRNLIWEIEKETESWDT